MAYQTPRREKQNKQSTEKKVLPSAAVTDLWEIHCWQTKDWAYSVFPLSCYFLQFSFLDRWKQVWPTVSRGSAREEMSISASYSYFRRNCQGGGPASVYPSLGREKGKHSTSWLWEYWLTPTPSCFNFPAPEFFLCSLGSGWRSGKKK